MKYERVVQFRVTAAEGEAWDQDAERWQMTLSQWVRSACATFLVAGKNTVVVPSSPEPPYVEKLRSGDKYGEPLRGTAGIKERMKGGVSFTEAREMERKALKAIAPEDES